MAKITLAQPTAGYNLSVINDNFVKIMAEFQDKVMYRNNPTGEPNTLETDMDANSKRIMNLPVPVSPNEAARLADVQAAIIGPASANLISNAPSGTITSTTVQGAINEIVSDLSASSGSSLIGYMPAGAGAVQRILEGKIRESVSVLDFYANGVSGAPVDPTGVIDSTLGIQAAVDASNHVNFPPGDYKINPIRVVPFGGAAYGINIPSGRTLNFAEGANLTAITVAADSSAILFSLNASNITINGGFLMGDRTTHVNPSDTHNFGIDFRNVTVCRINNTICRNFQGDGIYLGASDTAVYGSDIVVTNVDCNNNVRQGMSIVGANNVRVVGGQFRNTNGLAPEAGIDIENNDPARYQENIVIDGATFTSNTGAGVDILRGHNVTVTNCTFTGNRGGHHILGNAGGASAADIKLINNYYKDSLYNSLELGDNVDNLTIQSCTFASLLGAANGHIHYGTAPTIAAHIKLLDNIFYATKAAGLNVTSWGVADALSIWDVRGNTIYMGGGVQPMAWSGASLDFSDNTINIVSALAASATAFAINVATYARLENNRFNNSTGTSYTLSGSTVDIALGPLNRFTPNFVNSGFLSDYREGTWFPVLGGDTGASGQTYSIQSGKYIKQGRQVTVTGNIALTTKGTLSGSYAAVTGLPFAPATDTSIVIGYFAGIATPHVAVSGYLVGGSTTLMIVGNTAANTNITVSGFAQTEIIDGVQLYFTATYFV